ncbi:MAG: 50S ribosomal protein L11 methyltransferase, partial [Nitrospinota bacterium]|nr:50S ribosomal protein L11 methyltransferase [Nitrospinota bacterium]
TFPLIAANLFMEPHLRLAGEYWRLCAPGGWLILSGIRQEQAPSVLEKMTGQGFTLAEKMEEGDWAALVFVRPALKEK